MLLGMFVVEWRHLPKAFQKNKVFQKRFRLWTAYVLVNFLIHIEYRILGGIILNAGPIWQPILVGSLTIAREINVQIQTFVCHKAADAKDSSVEIFLSYEINTSHALFLCSVLGSGITTASSIAVVGWDLLLNLILTVRLIWIKKWGNLNDDIEKARSLLLSLLINEFVEVIIPLGFSACLIASYFGPNAELYGNIKSTYFHNRPIADIEEYLKVLGLFFLADVINLGITSLSLWFFAKINLIRAYLAIMNEFWPILTVTMAYWLYLVSDIFLNPFIT